MLLLHSFHDRLITDTEIFRCRASRSMGVVSASLGATIKDTLIQRIGKIIRSQHGRLIKDGKISRLEWHGVKRGEKTIQVFGSHDSRSTPNLCTAPWVLVPCFINSWVWIQIALDSSYLLV